MAKSIAEKFTFLGIPGAAKRHEFQQSHAPDFCQMSFEDRLEDLLDASVDEKLAQREQRLKAAAHLARPLAALEDLDMASERGIGAVCELQSNDYILRGQNVNIIGASGAGKSFLGCALGANACRSGFSVRYLNLAEADLDGLTAESDAGERLFAKCVRSKLLILDNFVLFRPTPKETARLFALIAERHGTRSTIVCSHYWPEGWHDRLGGDPVAEAIVDRLVANAFTFELAAETSLRMKYESMHQCDRMQPVAKDPEP